MQAKNDLIKSFRKAAVRATLAVMMTVGVLAPSVTVMAQTQVAPPASVVKLTAPTAETEAGRVATEISFTRVKDVEALAKQYPALSKLPAELKEYDEQQGGDNPAFVEIAKYTDKANGREMLFVHVTTPVLCSYEGCPLSVFLRDGKDFRNVLQVNASDPISVVTNGTSTSVMLPGAYGVNPSLEFRYDIRTGQFEPTRVADAQQQPVPKQVPAPLPAPSPKK
ncbi:MAG: hypothetical protein PSY14_08900 [bacterium]|nr:hypothetical protein [bacterium]MDI1227789.1 hypothetical protein [bacterium]